MDPWLGEQAKEVRVAGQPGEDRRAGFRAGFLGLPLGSSLGRKGRKRHEELKIGVLEPQDVAAGFTRIAGRAAAAARFAGQRAREIERRPSLPDAGRAVEEVGVPDVTGLQRGAEKR